MLYMDINIRQGCFEDAGCLADIEAICFPKSEAAGLLSFEARLKSFGNCFLIAEMDGKIIGFINGMVTDRETIADEMFEDASLHKESGMWQSIFGLDVLPEYRCRGVAAALMHAFVEMARAEGRKGCILTCKDRLIPYYSKFGYVNKGVSESQHGGAMWYDMILEFEK